MPTMRCLYSFTLFGLLSSICKVWFWLVFNILTAANVRKCFQDLLLCSKNIFNLRLHLSRPLKVLLLRQLRLLLPRQKHVYAIRCVADQLLLTLVNHLLELVEPRVKALLYLLIALAEGVLEHGQLTLPGLRVGAVLLDWRHHEQVVSLLALRRWISPWVVVLDDAGVVGDHLELDLQAEDVLAFIHFIIHVAHDRNDHVQERDLREEGCQDEEAVNQNGILVVLELLSTLELTQSEQVLVD